MTEKPLNAKAYGSIPHFASSQTDGRDKVVDAGMERIATKKARDWKDLVIVTEKLDGSNVAVLKQNHELISLIRAGYRAIESPYKQHHLFHNWVMDNSDRFRKVLNIGERICGEWLAQVHGTHYELRHEPFVAFDIMFETERIPYHEFLHRVLLQKFVVPQLIHIGQPISISDAMAELEMQHKTQSNHNSIELPEGMVWRVERDGRVNFLVKYVRPDFEPGKWMKEEIWNKNLERYVKISI
jgi:ATP-dependent RNA circularization protein (DNA/RNA ligase family)